MSLESFKQPLASFSEENDKEVQTALLKLRPEKQKQWKLDWEDSYNEALDDENHELLFKIKANLDKIVKFQEAGLQDELTEDDFVAIFSEKTESNHGLLQGILDDFKKAYFGKQLIEIDSGMAGSVFYREIPGQPDSKYCIKIINNPNSNENYKKYNSIKEEFKVQTELADIEIEGVRLPVPYFYIENKKFHVIVMEKLEADPLYIFTKDQTLGRPHKQKRLPDDFDVEAAFASLQKYMDEWHKRGYHHRDFHLGNIMLDRKTLKLLVIDTGRTRKFSDRENPYQETNEKITGIEKNYFPTDDEMLRRAYELIKRYKEFQN